MHAKLYDSSECFSCIINQKVAILEFQVKISKYWLKLTTANNIKNCVWPVMFLN